MKNSTRIFTLLACVLSSYLGFASTGLPSQNSGSTKTTNLFKAIPAANLMQSVPFYMEDFSSGVPANWQITDNAGNGLVWSWTTTGAFSTSPGIDTLSSVGTSASNGYMIFDSDSAGGVGGEDADLTSDAIDCSSYNVVHLRFNQLLYHFAENASVLVSTDGVAWSVVYDASFGLSSGQSTPNPDVVDVDITGYAALQSTVYIRFNFTGDYDFWWMIDDLELYEPAAADAGVFSISSPTTSCTVLSNAETISVEVYNFGSDSISGFDVSYIINGGTPVTETIADTIAPGFSYSYSFTATADLSTPGTIAIAAYTSLSGDAESNNDSVSTDIYNGAIQVTTGNSYTMGFESNEDFSRWSIEDGNFDGSFWSLNNNLPRTGSTCVNMSGVAGDDWLFTPCLELSDTISYDLEFYFRTLGTSTQANLEVMLGTLPASFGMTQTILASRLVNNLTYNRSFNNFSVPSAGVYYIGFHATNTDSLLSVRIDDINLAASSGVSVKELNKGAFSVFPNPTNGIFSIRNLGNSTNAKISIYDAVGQSVYQSEINNLQFENIDLRANAEGQYILRIISDSGVSTQIISVVR